MPEGAERLPRPEARRLPAFLLRRGRHAAGECSRKASNPQAIQPHLQGLFDSVVYVEFGKKEKTNIEVLFSADGQSIKLSNPVKAEGNIEEWLDKLLKEMQFTVNRACGYVASDCEHMDTESLTHKYQAQISLIGIQFKWTADSEDALYRAKSEKGIIKATNKKHQQRLTDLVSINMRSDQTCAQRSASGRARRSRR